MRQRSLFAVREIPEGLIFKPDFLTVQEERDLFALLHTMPFYEFKLHGVAAKRRVLHFGLRYALESRVLSTSPEIQSEFEPLRRRTAEFAGVASDEFSQILVNEYRPGAGIGWHHDSPAFGIVAGISLGATCTMRFQHGSGDERRTSALELPSRSIYLLTGDARNLWQHRIAPIDELRYSITMRTLRKQFSDNDGSVNPGDMFVAGREAAMVTSDATCARSLTKTERPQPVNLRSAKLRMTELGCG